MAEGARVIAPLLLYRLESAACHSDDAQTAKNRTPWFIAFALIGLAASAASTWVHYKILNDPTYASFCDVSSTLNCTRGVYQPIRRVCAECRWRCSACCSSPVVLALIALCSASPAASRNLARLHLLCLDNRAGGGPVSRVRFLLRSQCRVPAVCRHVCRGHRPLPAVRIAAHSIQ